MTQDPATLDQLRVLLAVVETGSFSAAGRQLHRVQSAISHAVATVESQLGAELFDRSHRRPVLTPTGEAVLILAREICARADALRRLADGLARGEEATVGLAVEALYPSAALARVCRDFAALWPCVRLNLHTDTLGGVAARVLDGTCALGVVGPAVERSSLRAWPLGEVELVPVAAPEHPLARLPGPIPAEQVVEQVQIVLSERQGEAATPDQGVLSARTWRVHDLQTKRTLLLEGLGWGNMPLPLVAADLAARRLSQLRLAEQPRRLAVALWAVTRPDTAPGPATRWLLERLGRSLDDPEPPDLSIQGI